MLIRQTFCALKQTPVDEDVDTGTCMGAIDINWLTVAEYRIPRALSDGQKETFLALCYCSGSVTAIATVLVSVTAVYRGSQN